MASINNKPDNILHLIHILRLSITTAKIVSNGIQKWKAKGEEYEA